MRLIFLCLLFISAKAFAGSSQFGTGITFHLGLGYGGAQIVNPDGTKANYKALGMKGGAQLPLFEGGNFASHLVGGLQYLDLQNNANSGRQSEIANMIGPSAGLKLRAFKFFVEYDYSFMLARHYAIGTISRSSKYNMPVGTMSAGITYPLKQLTVSFAYSQSSGTVPKASSELSKSSPYTDQVYWLQLSYSTGSSLRQFFSFLF
ncbi:MAG: hypothetical protein AB7H97_14415 [Pseudobdellovibrionaceae bacterium]